MKRSLPSLAISRPVTVLMIMVTLLALGGIALYRMPIEFLPEQDFPFIIVFIPYPGATPEQVEQEVAIPAEGRFRTVSQLKRIITSSNSNGCSVHMVFDFDADMSIAASEVRDRMERLKLELPDNVDRLFLQRFSSDTFPIMLFVMTTEGEYEAFSHMARTVTKSRIQRIDGVADVQIFSKPQREVLIQFDQDALLSRNLSIYQVVSALQTASLNISVGELNEGRQKYFVRVLDEFESPGQIADLVVGPNTLRLKEVADVGYAARDAEGGYDIDGRDGVVFMMRKESEANAVDVCNAIAAEIETFRNEPEYADNEIIIFFNQAEFIQSALGTLLNAGKYGGLLAVAVLWLFLRRLRPTLLVAFSIPSSVVVALVAMYFAGLSLNLVTMISLIIALGMLVDNAIVAIENIYRYNQLGLDAVESARRGASEVGLAITAATSTTLVVFLPILYLEAGQMSSYFKEFGFPIAVALGASLFIALTVIPLAASHMPELNAERRHPWRERMGGLMAGIVGKDIWGAVVWLRRTIHPIQWLIDVYARVLAWVLRWRLATVILLFLLSGITGYVAMTEVHMSGMPELDRRQIDINLEYAQTLELEHSQQTVDLLKTQINARRESLGINHIFANYWPGGGTISVFLYEDEELPPGESLPYATEQVRDILWQILPKQLPGVEVNFEIAKSGEGEKGIVIRLRGDDSAQLAAYAENLRDAIAARVPLVNEVKTDRERANEEIQLRIDETMAAQAGVSPLVVARTVDFALRGYQLTPLKSDGREVPLWAQFREENRKTRSNLENVTIMTERSGLVPLDRLVRYDRGYAPRGITRINGKNVTNVVAMVEAADLGEATTGIKQVVQTFSLPQGYSIEMGDKIETMETDMANFIVSMTMSCLLIYLVMGALFESFILPLSILFSIPLAFIGVVWIMVLTGSNFDPIALIGLVLMTGIIVNNGIVIIDHISQLRVQGRARFEAIIQAGRDRFRPVMMTALTTILGCVPLALGGAMGNAVAFDGLGRSLIGGLSAGTLLTLLVVPMVYSLIDDARMWLRDFFANVAGFKQGSRKTAPES